VARIERPADARGRNPLFKVRLTRLEAQVLDALGPRLAAVLRDPERNPRILDRLFPPAFRDRPEDEAAHRRLLGAMLLDARKAALADFQRLLAAGEPGLRGRSFRLTPAELELWLSVINDCRLLLALELDIQENGWMERGPAAVDDPRAFLELVVLSGLQESLLEPLSARLPTDRVPPAS
jgi:hypothetical protein